MKTTFTFCVIFIFTTLVNAQAPKDWAVMLQVTVTESPASITLKWQNISTTVGITVFRKNKSDNFWGNAVAILPGTATQYTDNTVVTGNAYEYYVRRNDNTHIAFGYIYAGIKLPETTYRGKLLLLVDANYSSPLAAEIFQLQNDLIGDGWQVKRIDISRNATVVSVKNIIKNEIQADANTKALYLLGRIPVPYSGGFVASPGNTYPPDGHTDHGGAWPADLYYGVLNESIWTDTTDYNVNDTLPLRTNNRNIPGDGKFDQMYIYPDTVALQIGRVDLTNMPAFGLSDTLLVKQYLDKAHRFKTGQVNVVRRGLVDDIFGFQSGEVFASTGWRLFSTMFGDSVFDRDYITSIKKGNYLFTYGSGGGSYTSANGIGTTSDFNNDSINTIFTILFGSYFGDWDSQDNFLRAPLCSRPSALASAWSGRPYWQFHHMSLGENIGYSTRLTQNNYYDTVGSSYFGYVYNAYPTFIHTALMGDPSLRLHSMIPVTSVKAISSTDSIHIRINWKPSSDAADGYVILSSQTLNGQFKVIGKAGATDTTFLDTMQGSGMNYYLVRAMKLENTPSGTYYNLALGVMDSAYSKRSYGIDKTTTTKLNAVVYPNPNSGKFTVYIDEQTPTHFTSDSYRIDCFDMTGKLLKHISSNSFATDINLSGNNGLILVRIMAGEKEMVKKVMIAE